MTNKHTPKGATGDARPRSTNTKAPATGIARAPGANGPSTREHSTPEPEKSPRGPDAWIARRNSRGSTAPTWRQAYPGMRALLRDMRMGAINLSSPKLSLGYLICRDVSRSEMACPCERETMQHGAMLAVGGIGEALAGFAAAGNDCAITDDGGAADLLARVTVLLRATGGSR